MKELTPFWPSYLTPFWPSYASIPDNLRHKLNFNLIKDIYDEIIGTPINITKSLPELAGKKITLSYSPATVQDEAVINSYLPKPHADGTPIDPSELPTSLPAYLINLKPELRIDGIVVATGTAIGMGNTETFKMTFTAPNESADVITNQIEAGEYLGIALDLGRISQEQLSKLKSKIESTRAKLDNQDFTNIIRDDIWGDMFYTTALSYYTVYDIIDLVTAEKLGVTTIRLPSENIFSYELRVNLFFGFPLSVNSGGLAIDVDRTMSLVKALDGNNEKAKEFLQSSSIYGSSLEHSVPERLFSTQDNPVHGISAVKALQIANDQGIPIYKINQTNINTILPQLQLDAGTIDDIKNAVNAGKEVKVSKTDITFNGWTGCGYIIIDPTTGAGAYMISGRFNGAVIMVFVGALMIIAGLATVPVGIILISYGIGTFLTGLFMYIGELTEQELDDFICALKVTGAAEITAIAFYLLSKFPLPMQILILLKAVEYGDNIKSALDIYSCFK
jgi:hypothetical protein